MGNPIANRALGDFYYSGEYVGAVDYTLAFPFYTKASELHEASPHSNCMAGLMLFLGQGCQKDIAKGVKLIRRSAELGYNQGAYLLGLICLGFDAPVECRDEKDGAKWIAIAANLSYRDAYKVYAKILDEGRGVRKDHKRSVFWQNKYQSSISRK